MTTWTVGRTTCGTDLEGGRDYCGNGLSKNLEDGFGILVGIASETLPKTRLFNLENLESLRLMGASTEILEDIKSQLGL